jgi:hypothetical protein
MPSAEQYYEHIFNGELKFITNQDPVKIYKICIYKIYTGNNLEGDYYFRIKILLENNNHYYLKEDKIFESCVKVFMKTMYNCDFNLQWKKNGFYEMDLHLTDCDVLGCPISSAIYLADLIYTP